MRVFTSTDFEGRWPVPVAAAVVADTEEDARRLLDDELLRIGLSSEDYTLQELDLSVSDVYILSDGDY